jgi:lipooligosaccharide transport system permease protein
MREQPGTRPPLLRAAEREVHVFRRLWRGSVSFAFIQPLLFLAAMGLGLGGLIDENSGDVAGVPYLAFLAPGLLGASSMLVAGGEALWPLMGRLKWMGSYKAMVATPVTAADAYGGWLVWIGLRTALAAVAFVAVAAVLGGVPSLWAPLAVPAAVLCGVAFAAPIGAWTATQETDFRFPLLMRLGIMPLFLFSGTFFPAEDLPDSVEWATWLSPLWHGVELTRSATTGDLAPAAAANVAVLAAIVAAGWYWGTRTFTRRLTP